MMSLYVWTTQGQLAKNVGNKAAEVVKSMDVDLSRHARAASYYLAAMFQMCSAHASTVLS